MSKILFFCSVDGVQHSISSFNIAGKTGAQSYLGVVIPLRNRQHAEQFTDAKGKNLTLTMKKDGQEKEIWSSNIRNSQIAVGTESASATIVCYKTLSNATPKTVVGPVIYYGKLAGGAVQLRTEYNENILPGDTFEYDSFGSGSFVINSFSLNISANETGVDIQFSLTELDIIEEE